MKSYKTSPLLINGVLILCVLSACKGSLKKSLISKINQECVSHINSNCTINLKQLTAFKWDKMYLFPNWTTSDSIAKVIGFKYNGDDVQDQYTRMLFTLDKKVVYEEDEEFFDNNNSIISFEELSDSVFKVKPYYLPVEKSVLGVKIDKEGDNCKNCTIYSFVPVTKSKPR